MNYKEFAINEVENRIENRLPLFGFDNCLKIDERFELYLFNHGAAYSAEIWDNESAGFIAETVAEARVIGTGDFADDIFYLLDLVFEDFEAYEGYLIACEQVRQESPAAAIALGIA